jgi:nitrogen PTS system EIIA component
MTTETSQYWKLFKPSACSVGLKGVDPSEVFGEVVKNMVKAKVVPAGLAEDAVKVLVDREQLASTGVGMGVAIPHVALPGLDSVAVSFSVTKNELEWQAIDGAPVRLLFTVLRPDSDAPDHDADRHLEMMRWVARMARNDDFRRFALGTSTRTELVDLMKEMSNV